jgi:hypothetical protein
MSNHPETAGGKYKETVFNSHLAFLAYKKAENAFTIADQLNKIATHLTLKDAEVANYCWRDEEFYEAAALQNIQERKQSAAAAYEDALRVANAARDVLDNANAAVSEALSEIEVYGPDFINELHAKAIADAEVEFVAAAARAKAEALRVAEAKAKAEQDEKNAKAEAERQARFAKENAWRVELRKREEAEAKARQDYLINTPSSVFDEMLRKAEEAYRAAAEKLGELSRAMVKRRSELRELRDEIFAAKESGDVEKLPTLELEERSLEAEYERVKNAHDAIYLDNINAPVNHAHQERAEAIKAKAAHIRKTSNAKPFNRFNSKERSAALRRRQQDGFY